MPPLGSAAVTGRRRPPMATACAALHRPPWAYSPRRPPGAAAPAALPRQPCIAPPRPATAGGGGAVSYTHLRAHETSAQL
eukprot:10175406-Alexandrium_andersonii.AAC.1